MIQFNNVALPVRPIVECDTHVLKQEIVFEIGMDQPVRALYRLIIARTNFNGRGWYALSVVQTVGFVHDVEGEVFQS